VCGKARFRRFDHPASVNLNSAFGGKGSVTAEKPAGGVSSRFFREQPQKSAALTPPPRRH
jgi:hypothetical protein